MVHSNPNMTKVEAIQMLGINRYFSRREVKVQNKMLAIKYHPGKWSERCVFTKEDSMEIFEEVLNSFDFMK